MIDNQQIVNPAASAFACSNPATPKFLSHSKEGRNRSPFMSYEYATKVLRKKS